MTDRDDLLELPQFIPPGGVIAPSVDEKTVSATSRVCNQTSVLHRRWRFSQFRRGGIDDLTRPSHKSDRDYARVADVEDVFLGEDGSIPCVVTWKPSLVTKENLVGRVLQRRCEELFKKKYEELE